MKLKNKPQQEITRDTIYPTYWEKEDTIRVRDMSRGYIKNCLDKMKLGYINIEFKEILEKEYKLKALAGAITSH